MRPEQVVILAGAQLALNLVLRLLATQGDEIVVENPCNQGRISVRKPSDETATIDIDPSGIDATAVANTQAGLAYLTPSHQFPMGATLSLDRRRTILRWAQRTGAYIIEDDYDCEYRYDGAPLPALMAMNSEHVIYLGTFSKSLGAGLRTGFAIFPEHLVEAAATAKALLDNGQVWLEQAALARFMQGGGFLRHLRRARQHYASRRNALIDRLHERFGNVDLMGDRGRNAYRMAAAAVTHAGRTMQRRSRALAISAFTLSNPAAATSTTGSQFRDGLVAARICFLVREPDSRRQQDRLADAIAPGSGSKHTSHTIRVPLGAIVKLL